MNLIKDIETLKQVVKINAAIPFESVSPYLNDAVDIYIEPQVGTAIVSLADSREDQNLSEKTLRCLGPLALALATDELGIQFGDSGITVDNQQGKRSPANEAKIAAAKENLFFRGMQALDRLLEYLAEHPEQYPDYARHNRSVNRVPCFIRSAQEYQDVGLVDIDYSTLTYRLMLPTIRQLQERYIRETLTDALYGKLLAGENTDTKQDILREHIIRYLANRSAALYTSQTSRQERINGSQPEYRPVIRPLYNDLTDTGNFFASQAEYYAGKIAAYLAENAEALGIETESTALKFNSREKKLFTSIS